MPAEEIPLERIKGLEVRSERFATKEEVERVRTDMAKQETRIVKLMYGIIGSGLVLAVSLGGLAVAIWRLASGLEGQ